MVLATLATQRLNSGQFESMSRQHACSRSAVPERGEVHDNVCKAVVECAFLYSTMTIKTMLTRTRTTYYEFEELLSHPIFAPSLVKSRVSQG